MTREDLIAKSKETLTVEQLNTMSTLQIAEALGIPGKDLTKIVLGRDSDKFTSTPRGEFQFNGARFLEDIANLMQVTHEVDKDDEVSVTALYAGTLMPLYYTAYRSASSPLELEDDFVKAGVNASKFREFLANFISFVRPEPAAKTDKPWLLKRSTVIRRVAQAVRNWDKECGSVKQIPPMLMTVAAFHAYDSGLTPDEFIEQCGEAGIDKKMALRGGALAATVLTYEGVI